MILCFLKSQACTASAEIRKFWTRIWPENDLSATCAMCFVVHNRADSPGVLREVEILVPRPGLINLADLSDLLLDENSTFQRRCSAGHEVEDIGERMVNYDGLDGVRVSSGLTLTTEGRGEHCSLVRVRLDRGLSPGQTTACVFSFHVP